MSVNIHIEYDQKIYTQAEAEKTTKEIAEHLKSQLGHEGEILPVWSTPATAEGMNKPLSVWWGKIKFSGSLNQEEAESIIKEYFGYDDSIIVNVSEY